MITSTKISVVTPAYNSERFISETIESVISQAGIFSLEYVIMDGGSSDRTREIVQHYQQLLLEGSYPIQCNDVVIHWYSEEDEGMYDAINKGFLHTTGEICAYINSDDIYLPGAFSTMARVFAKYPEIEWLKGISSFMSGYSTICTTDLCRLYAQDWIARGVYGRWLYFINQESVFWRRSLWDKVGKIDDSLKFAGDYYLWAMFSRHFPLVSVKAYVSSFRVAEGQLSNNMERYLREMDKVCSPDKTLKMIVWLKSAFRRLAEARRLLPVWMRPYVCRAFALIDRQKYGAVVISIHDDIQYYEGDYYFVSNKLLWQRYVSSPN